MGRVASLDDAQFLVDAGERIIHLENDVDDLRPIKKEEAHWKAHSILFDQIVYPEDEIRGYVSILKKYGLKKDAKRLIELYNKLREYAEFPLLKF